MVKQLFYLLLFLALGTELICAQTTSVKGVVLSAEDNEPIIGASVLAKGTTVGTVTDFNGAFTLVVPNSAKTLIISYIGMAAQEIAVAPDVRILLQSDTQALDEVIVVAYGTAKKSSFTGSASSIGGEKVQKMQVSSISKALEGAAPGVQVINQSGQPGENAKIRIRGIGSFSASSAPLYVVDGMPFNESAINTINSSDIESITVLKDAASASLYGSRAANGVVVITTKKGKNQKAKITFDARWGVNTRGIPEYDIMKDPGEYLQTYWHVLNNQEDGAFASANLITQLGYNPYIGVANTEVVSPDGVLTSAPLRYNDNWAKETLKNGIRQEYNINIQGGSENTTHYLSIGYLTDEGILRATDFERITTRANINHTFNKYIDIGGNLAYTRSEQNSGSHTSLSNYSNAFMFTQNIAPIYPVYAYDENGNRLYDENGDVIFDFGDGTYGARAGSFSNQNSVATSDLNKNQYLNDNFSSRGDISINPIEGLKLSANIGYDVQNGLRTRHMNQTFGDAKNVSGRTYKYNTRIESLTSNQVVNYEKSIQSHSFDVMAGHESYLYKRNYQYSHKYNFYVFGNPEFSNAITMGDMESYVQEHTIESYFGRINYNFSDKYYLSASLRTDASSKFHPDNRRGTFWSAGGSWRVTQENFMQDQTWMNDLKVKASYGTQGNDGILDIDGNTVYQPYLKQYNITNNNGEFSVVETYRGNKDLTWETSKNFNVGIEASMFNNRLKTEIEYFNKKTTDMLYNLPSPISSGISYVPTNLLDMKNQGIEFTISGTPVMTKDFTWNVSINGSRIRNKIESLPEDKRAEGIIHGSASLFRLMEGYTLYDFYTYEFAGIDKETGAALWYMDEKDSDDNVTGRTTTDDYSKATKYELGTALPDFQGAFSTDIKIRDFDFSLLTNFQIGGKVYDSMYANFMHAGSTQGQNWSRDILNSWTPSNTETDVPILDGKQNTNSQSSRFLIDGSFFNIRNISLGYSLPKNAVKAITATSLRVYISADNVALFSKRKGMDPRQYEYGVSAANYSAIRSISLGVNVNF